MQAKLLVSDISELIKDYNYIPDDEIIRTIQDTLRLSSYALFEDKKQLAGQMHGRLLLHVSSEIQGILKQTIDIMFPRLIPITQSLTSPGPLKFILKGHTNMINCIAISTNKQYAVSGSDNGILIIWDLEKWKRIPYS